MAGSLAFDTMHDALRAVAEGTRLRILALLAEAELTVSDLTEILRQSQPRISRHLKLLAEAGLIERHREGAWAFFHLANHGDSAVIARMLVERLDLNDPTIARDRERLTAVREARAEAAQSYFREPCGGMGSPAQAARGRRRGGAGDSEGARRQAVPLAARSRHRHRPYAGIVRAADRARPRHRHVARHAAAGARASGACRACAIAACGRATSTTCRCRAIPSMSSSSIRCCIISTTAPARSRKPRARWCRAAACW